MEQENAGILSKIGPDLLAPPHILTALMELLAGDSPPDLSQQYQLFSHLATCHYCRTAVVFLLKVAEGYDLRNNNPEEPVRDLLAQFEQISREAEAREAREAQVFERMGAYAEAIATVGQEKADERFPDVASHVQICPDCQAAILSIVTTIRESERESEKSD
jgi:hypothetical protein